MNPTKKQPVELLKLVMFNFQKRIGETLAKELQARQRVKPRIEVGMGRAIIFCYVADLLHPKTVSVLINPHLAKFYPNCKLQINKVNTDYIIDDREHI